MKYLLFCALAVFPLLSQAGWVADLTGAAALHARGIDGRGIKIAVFEDGCAQNPEVLNLVFRSGAKPRTNEHGTKVANIIGNKNFGIAPGAELTLYPDLATPKDFVREVHRAVEDGMQLINFSAGWLRGAPAGMANAITEEDRQAVFRAVEFAHSRGVLMIAANGNMPNNEALSTPAEHPLVLSVGGTSREENGSTDLSDNWRHDLLSYGIAVPSVDNNDRPVTDNGTSFAAPIVCGLAALALQQNPTLTPDELKHLLLMGAKRDWKGGKKRHRGWGYARAVTVGTQYVRQAKLDAYRATRRPIRHAALSNPEATWNAQQKWWELRVSESTPVQLQTRCEPENTTDFIHWYVGNSDVVKLTDERNTFIGKISEKIVFGRQMRFDSTILEARDASATNCLFRVKIILTPEK